MKRSGRWKAAIDQPRRADRDTDDKFLGGVAAGLAAHLGLQTTHVRLAFLVLALLGGFGVLVYASRVLLPAGPPETPPGTPGLDAATRQGMRTARQGVTQVRHAVAMSLAIVGIGAIVFLQNAGWWISPRIFWPFVVALAGLALLWCRQSDNRTGWLTTGGWKAWLRVVLGVALITGAVCLALSGRRLRRPAPGAGRAGTVDHRDGAGDRPLAAAAQPGPPARAAGARQVAGAGRHGCAPARLRSSRRWP